MENSYFKKAIIFHNITVFLVTYKVPHYEIRASYFVFLGLIVSLYDLIMTSSLFVSEKCLII